MAYYTVSNTGVAAGVKACAGDKFYLSDPLSPGLSIQDNYGFVVDDAWKDAALADIHTEAWVMLGDGTSANGPHFTLWNNWTDSGGTAHRDRVMATSGDNLANEMTMNKADNSDFDSGVLAAWSANFAEFEVGDLIRIGSEVDCNKQMRATIGSKTITGIDHLDNTGCSSIFFTNHVKMGQLFDSVNAGVGGYWVRLAYWGDITNTSPTASNPRQLQPAHYSAAKIGTEGVGGLTLRMGGGAPGVSVFDLETGDQKVVNVESGLDYLTSAENPHTDISAVTVADYTFLVNKKKVVKEDLEPKYVKRYEAFIEARVADYGKEYRVLIGGNTHQEDLSGAAKAVSVIDLQKNIGGARVSSGAILQAKVAGTRFNGYTVRLIQRWQWIGNYSTADLKPSWQKNPKRFTPTDKKWTDLLPPPEYVQEGADNKVAIRYDKDNKNIYFWLNYPWSNSDDVKAKVTTVKDLRDAIDNHSTLSVDWSLTRSDGVAFDDTTDATALAYYFRNVHMADSPPTVQSITYTKGRNMLDIQYNVGPDFTIGSTDKMKAQAWPDKYDKLYEGYLSPSVDSHHLKRVYGTNTATSTTASYKFNEGTMGGTLTDSERHLVDGEFFYKTPRWVGSDEQMAVGTVDIAEKLASNVRLPLDVDGKGQEWVQGGRRADGVRIGKTFASKSSTHYLKAYEECFGMTSTLDVSTPGVLQKFSITSTETNSRVDGHTVDWQVIQEGYTIAVKNPLNSKFKITVSDDIGGRGLKLTYTEVDEAVDLPPMCRHGHIVKVVGQAREEADDYYLRFESDSGNSDRLEHGRWVECVGYDLPYRFDKSSMPVGLVRESNGEFTLKELDWDERRAGDNFSNPFPSFSGNTISDIFLFRNRLGFLSGENVIFSEAGEYFNFFRTTTAALLDAAPIDVQASTTKVSNLHSAVPYNEKLLLFSDQTQFTLDAEPYLSIKTVTLTPSNEIDTFKLTPVVSSGAVFYAFGRTGFSGVGELKVSLEDSDQMASKDATSHVPKYIKGNIRKMVTATNEEVLCCITDDTTSATLYVYKFFHNAQNQKVQSAWFKYTFGAGNFITDISFIGNTLYMIIKRGSTQYIESLTFEDDQVDSNLTFQAKLDRKVDKSQVTVNAGGTVATLPYLVTADTRLLDTTSAKYYTQAEGSAVGTNTFTISNLDLNAASNFYVGDLYTLEYIFTEPFLKSEKTTETGRFQLQRAHLEFANARYFAVEVIHNPLLTAPSKFSLTNTFEPSSIQQTLLQGDADLQQGFYTFAIAGRSDALQLKLTNSTPYPSDFLSIDYEARSFSRGSRWRG